MGSIPTRSRHAGLRARAGWRKVLVVGWGAIVVSASLQAQQPDSVGVDSQKVATSLSSRELRDSLGPPVSPRSAFLRSLVLPGWGQAALNRPTAGAAFSFLEFLSATMVFRSKQKLDRARRFGRDSVVVFIDTSATPDSAVKVPHPLLGLVAPRRQQVEDWIAVMAANHLFAAADAFVAAHLWDMPGEISARPIPGGIMVIGRIEW
ncbi:MAG: hypothetical protein ABR543_05640 [Gemmatimonadaceae bacterium]